MDNGREVDDRVGVSRLGESHKSEKSDNRLEEISYGGKPVADESSTKNGYLEMRAITL